MNAPFPPTVIVRGLTKRYGRFTAVQDISFDAAGGGIFGLLGRNGAGKTTLLECLLGLRRPDAGTITIGGFDALTQPEDAKAIVGAQLQSAALQDKLTPREALRFFGSFYREPAPADTLLEEFGLGDKADAPFDSLSGGQKQRLFLALAFVHRPRVVVLDEPTAGLDPQARRELHALIKGVRARGVAVILSTHHLDEAEQLCDRVGILHATSLVAVGTPSELKERARAQPTILVRAARPLDPLAFKGLPGVVDCTPTSAGEGSAVVTGGDINQAMVSIAQRLTATGNGLVDVQIQRPTLEQVFIALTGTRWDEEAVA